MGLGSILLKHIIDRFSKSTIELHCYSNRHMHFYTKHGFKKQEEKFLTEDDTYQFFMTIPNNNQLKKSLKSFGNDVPQGPLHECDTSLDLISANEPHRDSKDLRGSDMSVTKAEALPQCASV